MFPLWVKIIFAVSAVAGLFFLIKSISKIIAVYNNPHTVELSATVLSNMFEINETGEYEIAVKTPYLFGVISYKISLRLTNLTNNKEIPVRQNLNLFSQRRNLSGERIVPVAECIIDKPGNYQLDNFNTEKFKERDKFQIAPKTGYKGFLLIFAIIFSALLFIGGLVMTVLSFLKIL